MKDCLHHHEVGRVPVHVDELVGVRPRLVVNVFVEGFDGCSVGGAFQLVASAGALGASGAFLHLVPVPVGPVVNPVLVELFGHRDVREDPVGDEVPCVLEIGDGLVRQRNGDVNVALERSGHSGDSLW